MKLRILGIRDAGVIEKERVLLLVEGDGDLGRYITAVTVKNGSTLSAKILFPYWFQDKAVKNGDLIVLYSKSGQSSSVKNEDGSTSWFMYRGVNESLFKEPEKCVVVFDVPSWSSSMQRIES